MVSSGAVVSDGLGVPVGVSVGVGVSLGVSVGVGDSDGVGESVTVTVAVGFGVFVGVGDSLGVGSSVGSSVGVAVGLSLGVSDASSVGVSLGDRVGNTGNDGVRVGEIVIDPEGVGSDTLPSLPQAASGVDTSTTTAKDARDLRGLVTAKHASPREDARQSPVSGEPGPEGTPGELTLPGGSHGGGGGI